MQERTTFGSPDVVQDAQDAQKAWRYSAINPHLSTVHKQYDSLQAPLPTPLNNPSNTLSDAPRPTSALSSPQSINPNDDEDFGPFQSSSTNAFTQPIFAAAEDAERDTLIHKPDPEQVSGTFPGSGIITVVNARLDASTRGVRRAGKMYLRKLNLTRENEGLGLNSTATRRAGWKRLRREEDGVKDAVGVDGVMRPVGCASGSADEVRREVAELMDGVVGMEKMAWEN